MHQVIIVQYEQKAWSNMKDLQIMYFIVNLHNFNVRERA